MIGYIKCESTIEFINNNTIYLNGIFYSIGRNEYMPNCSPLWFLTCIFISNCFFYWILKTEKLVDLCVCILFFVSSMLDFFDVPKLPWNIDSACLGTVFMYIGYKTKQLNTIGCITKGINGWIRILVMLTVGVGAIYYNPEIVAFSENSYGNPLLMLMGEITISISVLGVCKKIVKRKNIIAFIGKNTLYIMGFNYLANSLFFVVWSRIPYINKYSEVWWIQSIVVTLGFIILILGLERIRNCQAVHYVNIKM